MHNSTNPQTDEELPQPCRESMLLLIERLLTLDDDEPWDEVDTTTALLPFNIDFCTLDAKTKERISHVTPLDLFQQLKDGTPISLICTNEDMDREMAERILDAYGVDRGTLLSDMKKRLQRGADQMRSRGETIPPALLDVIKLLPD